ncbi:uncharacterized protein LOC129591687 [Paramacrobiotus metropolitanus]|uniref:uncharacterized protein LOC129591687 n=1 Tax=Paramacrobiotus metropolitanus TaxID=2943436 RepID=UPI002445C7D4|nr:uncharacterized protein LOC129591687 [Paramacrobiotus metropolitanus]
MIISAKFLLGIIVISFVGFVTYFQLFSSSSLLVLISSSSRGVSFDGNTEVIQLEAVIRNVTNATVIQIGSVYPSCTEKSAKIGTVLMRDFGDHSKEVWLIFQLHPERIIDAGLLKVRVFHNSRKLYTTHYDVCKRFLPSLKCPLSMESQTFGLQYKLPFFMFSGNYGIEAWTVDQKDHTFACILANLTV